KNGVVFHMLSEHWDGTNWSKVAMPGPADGKWNGIACPSATNCIAVGFDGATHAQVAQWNGTSWTLGSSAAGATYLTSVSCVSTTDCGGGGELPTGNGQTLVERWNGSTWSIGATPATATGSRLNAVACTSASSCTAVGGKNNYGDYFPPSGSVLI